MRFLKCFILWYNGPKRRVVIARCFIKNEYRKYRVALETGIVVHLIPRNVIFCSKNIRRIANRIEPRHYERRCRVRIPNPNQPKLRMAMSYKPL